MICIDIGWVMLGTATILWARGLTFALLGI